MIYFVMVWGGALLHLLTPLRGKMIALAVLFALFLGSYQESSIYIWLPSIPSKTLLYSSHSSVWLEISSLLLVYAIVSSQWLRRQFSRTCLIFFGKISFSLYLIHFPILCSFSSWFYISSPHSTIHHSRPLAIFRNIHRRRLLHI